MDVLNNEEHRVTLAADALHPNDNNESLNVGGEYMFNNLIAFRVGYKSLFLDNSEEGLTAGVGLNYILQRVWCESRLCLPGLWNIGLYSAFFTRY